MFPVIPGCSLGIIIIIIQLFCPREHILTVPVSLLHALWPSFLTGFATTVLLHVLPISYPGYFDLSLLTLKSAITQEGWNLSRKD